MTTHYQGQCHCGSVTFIARGEPLFSQHCHCHKCREIAALSRKAQDKIGYSYTAAYLTRRFSISHGEENLEECIRLNAKLLLCATCKSFIYGISLDPAKQGGIGVNANNFIFQNGIPATFQPIRHIYYADRAITLDDSLEKFIDVPLEQFGSGKLYA